MAPQRFSPFALARATVKASVIAGAQLGSDLTRATGRSVARGTRAVVAADVGVGPARLSPDTVGWAREQVATGLRMLLALPSDTGELLRTNDPTAIARAVLALIGGEEAIERMPSPDEQIRQRFRALLAPDAIDVDGVTPALLSITGQLSPDEARMLRHLDEVGRRPVVDVESGTRTSRGGQIAAEHLSMVVEHAGGDHPQRAQQYVANLVRLGLCAVDDEELSGHVDHDLIAASEPYRAAIEMVTARGGRPRTRRRTLRLTTLGERLVAVAIHGAGADALTVPALDGPPPAPPADALRESRRGAHR